MASSYTEVSADKTHWGHYWKVKKMYIPRTLYSKFYQTKILWNLGIAFRRRVTAKLKTKSDDGQISPEDYS